ncbi:MAG: PP2C family protein-serine/threonine phosphatase [bacterium]
MNTVQRIKCIFLALLGVIFIATYFWLFEKSKLANLLHLHVSKREILAKAEQAYQESPLAKYKLSEKVNIIINKNLLHYAQLNVDGDSSKAFFPVGTWEIDWRGKVETEEEEKKQARFNVEYDFKGNLIGFIKDYPQSKELSNLQEPEALAEAKIFLAHQNVDTSSIELTEKRITNEDNISTYRFSFTSPSSISPNLKENFMLTISGTEVTGYSVTTALNKDKFEFPKIEHTTETIADVLTVVVWAVIIIFSIVVFIKRVRHDEIEFRRAIWMGIAVFALMWTSIAFESWPEWWGVLLGGGLGGLFTGGGLLIVYAVTESLNREVWKEKLALTDLLFQGYSRVKETGTAILNSFFMAGLILLVLGILIWLNSNQGIGYLTIDEENLWIFKGTFGIFTTICRKLVGILYIGFMFLSFWPTYLRSKIQNKTVLIILIALFFHLTYLPSGYLRPTYLAFFPMIPIAMLWAYLAYKYDLFTILMTTIAIYLFTELSFISFLPDGFLSPVSVIIGILTFFILLIGVYLIFTKRSVKDFEHYVPEYVSRIAEHERFLKELEIARSVQMRFLPQSVPTFPNLDIASICRPAMEVGGDYYDFIREGNQCLSIVIGDVSGKGVSAAFYMTMAKGIIKTLSKSTKHPKELLTEMNTIFYENAPREVFISVIYGLFDMKNKTLTFARAGHNPLIVRKSMVSAPELLNPKGLAIGLESGQLFSTTIEEKTLPIEPGDLFVFYTDGISESINKNGEEFGEERFQQLISLNAHLSAQAILDKITQEINKFAGNANQHDDFTMVVVKVGG